MPAPAVVLGSMSKESIQQVIHRSLARVRYCYEKQLRRNPSLGGRVVVFFGIGADGGISDLKISSSTLGDPEVEKCILKALAPPVSSEPIEVPVVLSTGDQEGDNFTDL